MTVPDTSPRPPTVAARTYPVYTASTSDDDKFIANFVLGIFIAVIIGIVVLTVMYIRSELRNDRSPSPQYYYVPVETLRETKNSLVRILSWPAAKVFANDNLLSEAPSMEQVSCPSGDVTFRIVSKTGLERVFSTWLEPGKYYEIKADVQDLTHSVREIIP